MNPNLRPETPPQLLFAQHSRIRDKMPLSHISGAPNVVHERLVT